MTTFNAFWFGKPFNAFHWACIRSFTTCDHDYRLYVYDAMEVPDGVTLMDAKEILPRKELFAIKNPVTGSPDVGPFSDLFRYKLLLDRGGWYVDVDTICLADAYPDQIRAWAHENEKVEGKIIVNAAQICFPKGDPLARELYQRCLAIGRQSELREDWGPNLLTRVIAELRLSPALFGTNASFYPIDWIGAVSLALPAHRGDVERKLPGALFASAYQSFFQYCGIDLARLPPAGSYLRWLYDTLAANRTTTGEYETAEVLNCVRAYLDRNPYWAPEQLIRSLGEGSRDIIVRA
jgi:hypothetical protein